MAQAYDAFSNGGRLVAAYGIERIRLPVALGGLGLAVMVFVAGRVLFWIGYLIHPFARAPGMAVTLTVNILVVGVDLWLLRP